MRLSSSAGVVRLLSCPAEFWVNGSNIPFVDWDIGPSWAGLLPISNNTNETRQVRAPKVWEACLRLNEPYRCSSGSSLLALQAVLKTS